MLYANLSDKDGGAIIAQLSQMNVPYKHADGGAAILVRRDEQIVAAVRGTRPDVVVCPDPTAVFFGPSYFNHHDHRVVGWSVLDAVSPAAAWAGASRLLIS